MTLKFISLALTFPLNSELWYSVVYYISPIGHLIGISTLALVIRVLFSFWIFLSWLFPLQKVLPFPNLMSENLRAILNSFVSCHIQPLTSTLSFSSTYIQVKSSFFQQLCKYSHLQLEYLRLSPTTSLLEL